MQKIIKEIILILWYAWTNVSLLAAKLTASHVVTFDLEFVITPQIKSGSSRKCQSPLNFCSVLAGKGGRFFLKTHYRW